MSGILIVDELLGAHQPLVDQVPSANRRAGRLPDGVTLPALLLRSTSLVERQTLKRSALVRTTERISVTARSGNYRQPGDLLKIVRTACAGKTGTIAGFARVAVLSAGTGPDLLGPGNSFERTQDLHVTYDAPA